MDAKFELLEAIYRDWERQLQGGNWLYLADLQKSIPVRLCDQYLQGFPQHAGDHDPIGLLAGSSPARLLPALKKMNILRSG